MRTLLYKKATFVTQLPVDFLYTRSHNWLCSQSESCWRVGYTKFALRMLGELVDVSFDKKSGTQVTVGEIVGSLEGFKAISDIYSVGTGQFLGGNPGLSTSLESIMDKPYDTGWFYEIAGTPDTRAMDVNAYTALLDVTIEKILEKQRQEEGIE